MSAGIFYHCYFGKTKREIHNHKHILIVAYDREKAASWVKKYQEFKSSYLSAKQVQFMLFPQEIINKKQTENTEQSTIEQSKLIVLYDHYVLSLQQELSHRIKYKSEFTLTELWYFLCCLVNGGIEMTQIHNLINIYEQPIINMQNILLNEYGMIKFLGEYSSPLVLPKNSCFQTPTKEKDLLPKKNLLSATFSVGRIMASLIMLKELQDFQKEGMFDIAAFNQELSKHKPRLGLLFNIVLGMLQGVPQQRILLHQISALLYPYEGCMLKLQSFRLDRMLCQESMMNILINPAD